MKRFIIYHDDPDGRCAAAIAGRHADSIELLPIYIPIHRGESLPVHILSGCDPVYDELWIVDFSFSTAEMKHTQTLFAGVTWIDHHETAIQELASISRLFGGRQDIDYAACELAWTVCHPGLRAPLPVLLIADRDIWRFEYGDDTRHFGEAFQTHDTNPASAIWDIWLDWYDMGQLRNDLAKGKLLYEARQRELHRQVERFGREEKFFGSNHKVLTINLRGSGELGEIINQLGYSVAHCYIDEPTAKGLIRRHSLYSQSVNVGELAFQRGGGGHEHAAGWVEAL